MFTCEVHFFYKIEDNKFIDKCIGLQTARKVKSCDKRKERGEKEHQSQGKRKATDVWK